MHRIAPPPWVKDPRLDCIRGIISLSLPRRGIVSTYDLATSRDDTSSQACAVPTHPITSPATPTAIARNLIIISPFLENLLAKAVTGTASAVLPHLPSNSGNVGAHVTVARQERHLDAQNALASDPSVKLLSLCFGTRPPPPPSSDAESLNDKRNATLPDPE